MTRTAAREIAMQLVFSMGFSDIGAKELVEEQLEEEYYASLSGEDELFDRFPDGRQRKYILRLLILLREHEGELEGYISRYSRGWKITRISRVAVAIMKTAMIEVLYMDDVPNAAAINAAVEISKGYEDDEVVAFINGVLGGFMRGELGEEPPEMPEAEAGEAGGDAASEAGGGDPDDGAGL